MPRKAQKQQWVSDNVFIISASYPRGFALSKEDSDGAPLRSLPIARHDVGGVLGAKFRPCEARPLLTPSEKRGARGSRKYVDGIRPSYIGDALHHLQTTQEEPQWTYTMPVPKHERVVNESGVFAYYSRATQRIIRAVVKPCARGLMVSRKRKDDLPSVTVAWPTKPASAFLAFIGENLHYVGCRVTENRRNGSHRDAAVWRPLPATNRWRGRSTAGPFH